VFLIQTPAWGVESWFAGPVPVEGKGFGGWLVQSPSWREDIVVQVQSPSWGKDSWFRSALCRGERISWFKVSHCARGMTKGSREAGQDDPLRHRQVLGFSGFST